MSNVTKLGVVSKVKKEDVIVDEINKLVYSAVEEMYNRINENFKIELPRSTINVYINAGYIIQEVIAPLDSEFRHGKITMNRMQIKEWINAYADKKSLPEALQIKHSTSMLKDIFCRDFLSYLAGNDLSTNFDEVDINDMHPEFNGFITSNLIGFKDHSIRVNDAKEGDKVEHEVNMLMHKLKANGTISSDRIYRLESFEPEVFTHKIVLKHCNKYSFEAELTIETIVDFVNTYNTKNDTVLVSQFRPEEVTTAFIVWLDNVFQIVANCAVGIDPAMSNPIFSSNIDSYDYTFQQQVADSIYNQVNGIVDEDSEDEED